MIHFSFYTNRNSVWNFFSSFHFHFSIETTHLEAVPKIPSFWHPTVIPRKWNKLAFEKADNSIKLRLYVYKLNLIAVKREWMIVVVVAVVFCSTIDTNIDDEWLQITSAIFPSYYCNSHMREYFCGSFHSFRRYMEQYAVLTLAMTVTVSVTRVMLSFLHTLLPITKSVIPIVLLRASDSMSQIDHNSIYG